MTEQDVNVQSRARSWRRWIAPIVLLGGIAYVVARVLYARPVEVEVVYHYGAARQGLVSAQMRYLARGEEFRRVEFHYTQRPAPEVQRHTVRLPRGNYDVAIKLYYSGMPPAAVPGERQVLPNGEHEVSLSRPLIMSGAEAVSIYLAE